MILRFLKYLTVTIISVQYCFSQEFVPPIQNYSPNFYNAASQNWDVAVAENGFVYVANNQGLLLFDGINWELHTLPGPSIIRSVYVAGERIFTGSYQEFGYWEFDDTGNLTYTSLKNLMKDIKLESEEFWDITAIDGDIYFRSFGAVYKYDGKTINRISNLVTTAFTNFNGQLLIAQRRNDISVLDKNGKVSEFISDAYLKLNNVVDMIAAGDTLFIGTRDKLYTYSEGNFSAFPNIALNNLLASYELNHLVSATEKLLVFGTVKNGIVVYDRKAKSIVSFNRASGLQNNTVLGMAADNGKIWLALDRGVDLIDLDSPVKFYTDNTGELGAVYDLVNFAGNTYIASNTGIYNFKNDKIQQLRDAEGHTWNLEVINNRLFANHNTGTFLIDGDQLIPIDTRTGSFQLVKNPLNQNEIFICHYTGLSRYDLDQNKVTEVDSVNFPVKEMVIQQNELWMAHPYEGLFHAILGEDQSVLKVEKLPALDGKNENYKPRLYHINNQVVAFVNGKWFKYNFFKNAFEDFTEFSKYQKERLIKAEGNQYYFLDENSDQIFLSNLEDEVIPLPNSEMNTRLVKANENVIKENDSVLYVTLNDGYAKVEISQLNKKRDEAFPVIRQVRNNDSLLQLGDGMELDFQNSRNLVFKVGMPNSSDELLEYRVMGSDSIRGKVENGMINLRNLNEGPYTLLLDKAGANFQDPVGFDFVILPPWYLSNSMKLIYLLIFLFGLGLIIWFNKQKLRKHQLRLEEKFEAEHKERLEKLEKQQLMKEIDVKRKELANTTMMAAKKNEVLMEIQSELNKDKVKFSNEYRLKHIMTKINRAVKNKDEWKVFETNFNEVHEDFFKEVLERFPNLTNKDLKLCSYLKMNLSSKEIAPLMGISVRGVEVHRYRLRKKMDLDSKTNLTKFLIKNF
ncbi:MAG: LuxR C-terminal-related transcriptional regulator [Christiangramia sp.]|uniref:LuxR C-terminal-related transcriptional regulator n=1 Tax=Christiangramia sp. TaxID=1931228 RepID=UPI003242F008